jgi:Ca2+-binding EF-hand superfamily protein
MSKTKLTHSELVELRTTYREADKNGNGLLDKKEFVKLLGEYGVSEKDAAVAFVDYDKDKSGNIDMREWINAMSQ